MSKRIPDLAVRHKSLGKMINEVLAGKYDWDMTSITAQYQIFSMSGAGYYGPKAQRQRDIYFKGMHFRSLEDLFAEFDKRIAKSEKFII